MYKKIYYKDFDIIIIDSNSTDVEIFNEIPKDVIIDYAKNNNYVSGAWKYAINKYDYDLYLFVQDSLIPLARIEGLEIIRDFSNIVYDIPYTAKIGQSDNKMNFNDLERLRYTYKDIIYKKLINIYFYDIIIKSK